MRPTNPEPSLDQFLATRPVTDGRVDAATLGRLLQPVCAAAGAITRAMRRGALGGLLGGAGAVNVQGEHVQQLDRFGNERFVEAARGNGLICTVVSEEMEKPEHFSHACGADRYALLIDPVDGSSNIDLNLSIGTIFSLLPVHDSPRHGAGDDLLRPGRDQIAAGYVLYGPGAVLVFTAGCGVHGFTLDPDRDEFVLTHEDIRLPERGTSYSVNEGNYHKWPAGTQRAVDALKRPSENGRPYSLRYVGALVADLHRTLLTGGLYLYPGEAAKPEGKLRLLYECAPLAFVAEQAGGRASTGRERILDLMPRSLHQRCPLVIGSAADVAEAENYMRETL